MRCATNSSSRDCGVWTCFAWLNTMPRNIYCVWVYHATDFDACWCNAGGPSWVGSCTALSPSMIRRFSKPRRPLTKRIPDNLPNLWVKAFTRSSWRAGPWQSLRCGGSGPCLDTVSVDTMLENSLNATFKVLIVYNGVRRRDLHQHILIACA